MAEIVYRSGPDYGGDNYMLWSEEGELPQCVDIFRTGEFVCNCGKHKVLAEITIDPLDGDDRMARTVTLI